MNILRTNSKYYLSSLIILAICIIFYQWIVSGQDTVTQASHLSDPVDSGKLKAPKSEEHFDLTSNDSQISTLSKTIDNKYEIRKPSIQETTLNKADSIYSKQKELASISPDHLAAPPGNSIKFRNDFWNIEDRWRSKIESPGLTDELTNVAFTGASDALSFVSNPLRWDSNDLMNLLLVTSGTLLLYSVDNQINKSVTHGGPTNNDLIKFGRIYGESKTTEYTMLGIAAYGIILNDKKALQLGLELFESFFIADNISGTLKYALGRSRPSENTGAYSFEMFQRPKRLSAFPSGHTTIAFSMSTVLASVTDDTKLKILIYIPAFLTAFSRMYENHHWASDVFMGAAIGHFVGSFVVSRHNPFRHDGIEIGMDEEGRPGIKIAF